MTQDSEQPPALKYSTASMRRRKQREHAAGYRRSTVALSPVSLDVIERMWIGVEKGPR
jgi:hypothetical protein